MLRPVEVELEDDAVRALELWAALPVEDGAHLTDPGSRARRHRVAEPLQDLALELAAVGCHVHQDPTALVVIHDDLLARRGCAPSTSADRGFRHLSASHPAADIPMLGERWITGGGDRMRNTVSPSGARAAQFVCRNDARATFWRLLRAERSCPSGSRTRRTASVASRSGSPLRAPILGRHQLDLSGRQRTHAVRRPDLRCRCQSVELVRRPAPSIYVG